MAKFSTKAERAFDEKSKAALAERDWDRVAELYLQLGTYLELVEPEPELEEAEEGVPA